MSKFVTPLKERQRLAAYWRERYRTDAEFRLRKINDLRVRQGLKPRASVDEIAPRSRAGLP